MISEEIISFPREDHAEAGKNLKVIVYTIDNCLLFSVCVFSTISITLFL